MERERDRVKFSLASSSLSLLPCLSFVHPSLVFSLSISPSLVMNALFFNSSESALFDIVTFWRSNFQRLAKGKRRNRRKQKKRREKISADSAFAHSIAFFCPSQITDLSLSLPRSSRRPSVWTLTLSLDHFLSLSPARSRV